VACLVLLLCGLVLPGSARGAIDLEALHFSSIEAGGEPSVLAGAHPSQVTTSFVVASRDEGSGPIPLESPRNLTVDLPPGMVGNAAELPRCSQSDLEASAEGCPPETQIGYVELITPANVDQPPLTFPMYNLKPSAGFAAMFGLSIEQARARVVARLDPSRNYGVSIAVRNLPQVVPWTQLNVVIWGVPGGRPLLTNPSACMPALSITAHVDSWQNPGVYDTETASNEDGAGHAVGITGCDRLSFEPALTLASSASTPRAPTGLRVALHTPQIEDPEGRAEATLEKATVTLPQGVAISPSAGAGLGSCAAAQIRLGSDDPPTCPDDSKLGTLTFETPLLDEPLTGRIYLARPWDNPFGSRLAVYGVAEGSGVLVKLAGRIDADPATGQLRVAFDRLPQLPFRDLRVDFWDGPRSLLSNPPRCGTYIAASELTAWGAAEPVERPASFKVSAGCSEPRFEPTLSAGSRNPAAGAFSPFALRLWREDSDGEFAALASVDLPPGLAIALKGMAYCPNSALETVGVEGAIPLSCPTGSRVGSVVIGAGPGPSPFYGAPGEVYLAGPYRGAPLSLAISVPAAAGPFDLGSVNLRAALAVDPTDLHADVLVDRLPVVLAGIPLQMRDLRFELDRPRFVRNPTSCRASGISASVVSTEGMSARPTVPFRVAGCRRLAFAPKLDLRFTGATHRSAHPALRATLTMPRGGSNFARAAVTLPKTELFESAHIRAICGKSRFAAGECPKGSVYGYVKAWSPLLDQPLQGPVYLRSSNHMLPDLVASLDGQIKIDLTARIESPGGRLRAVFAAIPDAPISKLVLTMQGGRKGLLVNNTQLCKAKPRARAEFTAQNDKRAFANPPIKTGCGNPYGKP
jgi:hypothetical protein